MKTEVLAAHDVNIWYLDRLLEGLDEATLTKQPAGLKNHPIWIVGHLAWATDVSPFTRGHERLCSPRWVELFGRQSEPVDDPSAYPPLAEVRAALREGHHRVAEGYLNATAAQLNAPNEHPLLSQIAPNVHSMAIFGMMGHEATHLGQLTCWRRAMGLPAMF